MSEEQVRGIMEQLENGVEVKGKAPDYFNAVVGHRHVGYVIALFNAEGKQINIILKALNNKELFKQTIITMTIHSIFYYTAKGEEKHIQSTMIGREVIVTSYSKGDIINDNFFLTGILNLKKEPP